MRPMRSRNSTKNASAGVSPQKERPDSLESGSLKPKLCGLLLFEVQRTAERSTFLLDLFLQQRDRIDQLFRTRRASGNVNVDRNPLVHSLDESVVVEDSARSRTGAHGDDPLRLRHLVIKLLDDRRHLL